MKKQLIAIAWFSLSITACQQGLGERCQVSADCATPLVCNQASMVCVASGNTSGDIDAATPPSDTAVVPPPIDAPPIDAAPIDAPPIDAAPDGP